MLQRLAGSLRPSDAALTRKPAKRSAPGRTRPARPSAGRRRGAADRVAAREIVRSQRAYAADIAPSPVSSASRCGQFNSATCRGSSKASAVWRRPARHAGSVRSKASSASRAGPAISHSTPAPWSKRRRSNKPWPSGPGGKRREPDAAHRAQRAEPGPAVAALQGGLRISEVCNLRVRDLQSAEVEGTATGQVTVFGKGGKERVVLLKAAAWRELQPLCIGVSHRSREGGDQLDPSQVHRGVKKAAARAGLSTDVSAHWLRHAHVSHALDAHVEHTIRYWLRRKPCGASGRVVMAGTDLCLYPEDDLLSYFCVILLC
jgi:Phage integrase family